VSDTIVLCYHALSERWDAALSVTPEQFEKQLMFLIERGYTGSTFEQAVSAPPAGRTFAVTFDDGFRSVFDLGFPILSRLKLPATLFVPTRRLGDNEPLTWAGIDHWVGGPHSAELTGMSWAEVEELARAGWEIGSHTRSHPHLTDLDDAELTTELHGSREDCEQRLGRPCPSLAYPYGDFDDRVLEAAGLAGYRYAGTLDRFDRPNALRWPRVGVYHHDDLERFRRKVSPSIRRLRGTPAWPLISGGRHILRRWGRRRP
jgi:peptidoglycan/xylan/chitin deacetylase (PgdA/CDA1 family)